MGKKDYVAIARALAIARNRVPLSTACACGGLKVSSGWDEVAIAARTSLRAIDVYIEEVSRVLAEDYRVP